MCEVGGIVSGPRIYESLVRYAERDAFVAAARAPSGTSIATRSSMHKTSAIESAIALEASCIIFCVELRVTVTAQEKHREAQAHSNRVTHTTPRVNGLTTRRSFARACPTQLRHVHTPDSDGRRRPIAEA